MNVGSRETNFGIGQPSVLRADADGRAPPPVPGETRSPGSGEIVGESVGVWLASGRFMVGLLVRDERTLLLEEVERLSEEVFEESLSLAGLAHLWFGILG